MIKKQLFVCQCHLHEQERVISSYLVLATNKREARQMMQDGEHAIDAVITFAEHVLDCGWENLTVEEEEEFFKTNRHCLFAGT